MNDLKSVWNWIKARWPFLMIGVSVALNGCAIMGWSAADAVRVRAPKSVQEALGVPANASVSAMVDARNAKAREIAARRAAEDEAMVLLDEAIAPRADLALELDTLGGTLIGAAFEEIEKTVNLPAKFGGLVSALAAIGGLGAHRQRREDALYDEALERGKSMKP